MINSFFYHLRPESWLRRCLLINSAIMNRVSNKRRKSHLQRECELLISIYCWALKNWLVMTSVGGRNTGKNVAGIQVFSKLKHWHSLSGIISIWKVFQSSQSQNPYCNFIGHCANFSLMMMKRENRTSDFKLSFWSCEHKFLQYLPNYNFITAMEPFPAFDPYT